MREVLSTSTLMPDLNSRLTSQAFSRRTLLSALNKAAQDLNCRSSYQTPTAQPTHTRTPAKQSRLARRRRSRKACSGRSSHTRPSSSATAKNRIRTASWSSTGSFAIRMDLTGAWVATSNYVGVATITLESPRTSPSFPSSSEPGKPPPRPCESYVICLLSLTGSSSHKDE